MKASIETSRPRATSEYNETEGSPAMTVSTDALRVGLAHLIHEINSPLQFVYNAVMEMNLSATSGCRDPLTAEIIKRGNDAIEELTSLIHSLRSELEVLWQLNPSFEVLNLSTLIDEIIQSEAKGFEADRVFFAKNVVGTLPLIQGNKTLLEVAIRNLFKNASNAMPEGGELRIKIVAAERSVDLEISNSGPGIPPDLDVFQPFATSKPGGTGLGLAIVRHIVDTHKGSITYKSQLGKETTFCMVFPSHIPAPHAMPVQHKPAEQWVGCLCHAPYK